MQCTPKLKNSKSNAVINIEKNLEYILEIRVSLFPFGPTVVTTLTAPKKMFQIHIPPLLLELSFSASSVFPQLQAFTQ